MRILASSLFSWLAPNVGDAGVCADTEDGKAQIIESLDLACDALHTRLDQDFSTLWTWAMPVFDQCFALPEDCLEGRQMWINGGTATQHDEWYQGKLACGLRDQGSIRYGPEITDLGQFAIPHKLVQLRDTRVAFIAQSDADAGKVITVELTNEYGETVKETLTLLPKQQPVVTESQVRDVTFLQKPFTQSNVKCYQHFPTGQLHFICDYSPRTLLGAWRRKKIPQCFCGCAYVTIKGKRRYQQITSGDDICPFDNRIAIKFAVQAIASVNRNDPEGYAKFLLMALNEIQKQMKDSDSPSNVSQATFRSGMGSNPSQAANNPLPGTSMWGRGRGFGYG